MMRFLFLATAFLISGGLEAWAQYRHGAAAGRGGSEVSMGIGARYRLWKGTLDGDIQAEDGGLAASDADVEDTLGLDDQENITDLAIWLPNLPLLGQLHAQLWQGKWSGDRVLQQDLNFAGRTFASGTTIDTESDWTMYTFLWQYGGPGPGLVGGQTGIVGMAGFKYASIETKVEGGGVSEDVRLKGIIPVMGVEASFSIAFLELQVEANGAWAFGLSGINGTHFDVAASARIQLAGLFAGAGYRWVDFNIKDDSPSGADEMELDLSIKGIFFEGGLRF